MSTLLFLPSPTTNTEETLDLDGKFVRIKRCMAVQYHVPVQFHFDNIPTCVCSLIGCIVKIEKYNESEFVFKIVSLNKFVRERSVELLKEVLLGNVPLKRVYIRKNGEYFCKGDEGEHGEVELDDKEYEWIWTGKVEKFDPNEVVQLLCD